ncbi:DUF2637 domain-containing protein [Nonomuraea sediminis]|uniref:DUF2637 domain-containing protein n=1 Tax=Nonomuraea sediminis TaxID=2835864 RepID=UPI001BDCF453|nr:DUF2637 domain-containing protein [Nonomuraea sediminis]
MSDSTSAAAAAPTRRTVGADPIERGGLAVVVAAAVVLSFSALQGLGEQAGFGAWRLPLLGWDLRLSLLLPLCIDAYGAVAARIATNRAYSAETRRHAFVHSAIAIGAGVIGNAAYHLIEGHVLNLDDVIVGLVLVVSVVPPVALGALVHLMSECARDRQAAEEVREPDDVPGQVREPDDVPVAAGDKVHAATDAPAEHEPASSDQPAAPADYQPQHAAQISPAPKSHPEPTGVELHVPAPSPLHLRAVQTFAPGGRLEKVPPLREIKSALGVGQPKASEVQRYLELIAS